MSKTTLVNNLRLLRRMFILLLILIIVGTLLIYFQTYFDSPEKISNYIKSLGLLGPLFLILIVSLEVLIAPIPGVLISIASGYTFGVIEGTIYNYIGNLIGNSIAFYLAWTFGRPFVQKIVKQKKLEVYDCFLQTNGKYILWLGFLFPVFPSDIISLAAGISKIRFKTFISILSIAFIPNMIILNYYGETLFNFGVGLESLYFSLFLIILFLIALLIYIDFKNKNNHKCKFVEKNE